MPLEKVSKIKQIEVVDLDGHFVVHVTTSSYVLDTDTGEKFGSKEVRRTINATDDYSSEPDSVRQVADMFHTPQAKASYKARFEAALAELEIQS